MLQSQPESRSARIARSFAALASGDAVARVVAFVAGVYVARRLGAEAFGVMAFAQAVVLYFTHLAACGVDLTGIREVAAAPERAGSLVPSVLTLRTLVSAGLAVLLAAGAIAFLPLVDASVLALYALTLFGHGPNAKFALIGLSRPGSVALARSVGEVVYVALVLLLARHPTDIVYVPWAQALGDLAAVLLMLVALKRLGLRLPLELDWPAVKPLFARSFPLVLNILLGLMIFNSDLIALRFFRDTTTVGWYSASYQLISFLINMAWAYSYSLLPALTQARADTGERRALYESSLAHSFAIGLPIAVGGALTSSGLIALVFGPKYGPAALPLAILIASIPFMLFKDVAMIAMIVAGREKTVLRMTAIAVVFNLVAIAIVIPPFGMLGAAAATLATEVLRAVLAASYVRRDGFAFAPLARFLKSLAAAAAMAGVLFALRSHSVFLTVPAGALAYALALYLVGGIELRRGTLPALRV